MKVTKTVKLKTTGMECYSCEKSIENGLSKMDGVVTVKSDYQNETTEVEFTEETNEEKIRATIKALGYGDGGESRKAMTIAIGFFAIIIGAYFIFGDSFDLDFSNIDMEAGFAALFILGFLTGFHCIGMCGGFVLSYADHIKRMGNVIPHVLYGSGKTISYTAIGAFFGLVGSFISFTPELRGSIAIIAGIFLLIYGLNMLNIFPVLRKLQVRIPSIVKAKPGQGPFVTGILNGFMIACGPLQAMYIFAAGTGSVVAGAQALFFFGMGTLAPLLTFGIASNFLSSAFSNNIVRISGLFVIILGIAMANNGMNLLGLGFFIPEEVPDNAPVIEDGYQVIQMNVTGYGWEPNSFVLKKGIPVRWEINGQEINGCNNEIIVREYGLSIPIKKGIQVIEFTPGEEGVVKWSCWMGMIPGQFIITDDENVTVQQIPVPPQGFSCGESGGCGCGGSR